MVIFAFFLVKDLRWTTFPIVSFLLLLWSINALFSLHECYVAVINIISSNHSDVYLFKYHEPHPLLRHGAPWGFDTDSGYNFIFIVESLKLDLFMCILVGFLCFLWMAVFWATRCGLCVFMCSSIMLLYCLSFCLRSRAQVLFNCMRVFSGSMFYVLCRVSEEIRSINGVPCSQSSALLYIACFLSFWVWYCNQWDSYIF